MRKTRRAFRNVKKGGVRPTKKKKKKIKMPKFYKRKPKPYVWTRKTVRSSPTKKRPKSAMKTGKGKRSKTKRRR